MLWIHIDTDLDTDPYSTYLPDVDLDHNFLFYLDPDPNFKKGLKTLKSAQIGSYSIHFA